MAGGILDDASYPTPTFFERQFDASPTPPQIIFDVIWGVLMPIICFYFDPGILRGDFHGILLGIPLARYTPLIYMLSALAIILLILWLALEPRFKLWSSLISGALLAGSAVSLIIGLEILPLNFFGLMFGIGILGFVPFITGFVYVRNGVRAMEQASADMPRVRLIGAMLLGAAIISIAPAFAQREGARVASESIAAILGDDDQAAQEAVNRAKLFRWIVDSDRIFWAFEREQDPARKQRLADAYKEITGEDANVRLMILRD